jgi:dihydroorotase
VGVILIKDIRVVDPSAGLDARSDVLVASGLIARIGDDIPPGRAVRAMARSGRPQSLTLIDGEGLWLWPGLVDAHVHLREPGFAEKETVRTGSLAAAAGGYTSVVCEPNTEPPIDSVDSVRRLAEKCGAEAVVNVYFKAAMTEGRRGRSPSDVAALAREERVVALSDDGDPVVDPSVAAAVCRAAAEADVLLSPHCEDSPSALRQIAAGVNPGFEPDEPYTNEANYVKRDLGLAADHGCRIHFSHVSLARSVEVIERSRADTADGIDATFETTPHYVLLCADDFGPDDRPTVNPPLRSEADRSELVSALLRGAVDAVASDHAPHTARDKAEGASGLIGLETTLGLILTHFVADGRLSPSDAVRLLSWNPARIFRLPAGTLRRGSAADMVLIDPEAEWTVDAEQFRSKSRNTPFNGQNMKGRAVATFVGGEEVHVDPSFHQRKQG